MIFFFYDASLPKQNTITLDTVFPHFSQKTIKMLFFPIAFTEICLRILL